MMHFLYGTGNPAKVEYMRRAVNGLPMDIVGLDAVGTPPKVSEAGQTPLENARLKAEAYYAAFHMPVFSCDSGLYLEGVPESEQPGLYVRRAADGHEMTDAEMTAHYGGLARAHGGRLAARYKNGIYLIADDTHRFSSEADDLSGDRFWLTDVPHTKYIEGFPLDRISLDMETGTYFYDRPVVTNERPDFDPGFQRFFESVLRALHAL